MRTNDKLADIFADTMQHCRNNDRLIKSIENTIAKQKFIGEDDDVPVSESRRYEGRAKIVVSKKRSYEAAKNYPGQKVAVLNFASSRHPGGGVESGASAQEECLCRCSTLYSAISDKSVCDPFHKRHSRLLREGKMDTLYNDDIIYSPEVCVFKTDTATPELMPESDWYNADVITCAAPNLRGGRGNAYKDSRLLEIYRNRMTRILKAAKAEGAEVLILGAFGCGAFQNSPALIAMAWHQSIQAFMQDFKVIEFAVYCTPRDSVNYDRFMAQFRGMMK